MTRESIADGEALENFGKARRSPSMVVFKRTVQCWNAYSSILSELFQCCEIIQGYIVFHKQQHLCMYISEAFT